MFAAVTLGVAFVLAASFMLAGHYVAPKVKGSEVGRLQAYMWGCGLGIWLPFAGWALFWYALHEETMAAWLPAVGLAVVIAGAGVGTLAAWGLDRLAGLRGEHVLRDGQ